MAPKHRVIIDTDPGVDDTLALLLALSADPEQLQVELISVTYGNVEVENCLRNVVSIFYHIEKEIEWRKSVGRPEGFEMFRTIKPLVAVGASAPLADQQMMADYFHGRDGLGNIYQTHPHLSPDETWRTLFNLSKSVDPEEEAMAAELRTKHTLFEPSQRPAHEEILRLLRENERDTFTIVAVGPLTNLAIAAATDPETFLRVKEVVVMGGAINIEGNITPVAEFNTYADSIAAARVYALTSPFPHTTMPPTPPPSAPEKSSPTQLPDYPKSLSRTLNLSLFPLDITTNHWLRSGTFTSLASSNPSTKNSPLSAFLTAFLSSTFAKMASLHHGHAGDNIGLSLHDPLCVWYLLSRGHPQHEITLSGETDVRVETSGQWTRGMYVVDRRDRKKMPGKGEEPVEVLGDAGLWLDQRAGNRIRVAFESGGVDVFGEELIKRILGI